MDNNDTTESAGNEPTILAGYLASSLEMEESISKSVYEDYMDAKNWPENLPPEIFENIKQYLSILIKDTERHRKTILSLIEKYERENQSK